MMKKGPIFSAVVLLAVFCGATEAQAATYTLTVTANQGSVRVTPEKAQYDEGEVVELIPRPEVGYYFTGWSGDLVSKRLAGEVTMGSNKSVTANFGTWRPPIGIPVPEFGISETHYMYEGQTYDFGSGPEPYRDAGNGPYTHYVDSTHVAATNTNNPYGTPSQPRLSIPRGLPAGSVVEIHNSSSPNGWDAAQIGGTGTVDTPIFVRGIGLPRMDFAMEAGYYDQTRYIIVEGVSFLRGAVLGYNNSSAFNTSHVAVRRCEFRGDETHGGFMVVSWSSNSIEDIVLYGNSIHDNGIWDPDVATGDQDKHGISVGASVGSLWVVDNEMYHNSGDGVQINSGSAHHIYIGRNIAHHNKQTGLWTKTALDILFSENVTYGHRPSSSADGSGMGFQYDPKRVWFLFNRSYHNKHGISCGSGNVGGREEIYFIGNVIHDVTNGLDLNSVNTPEPAKLIGNTIYRSENGIANHYYSSSLDIINNIIDSSAYHVYFQPGYDTHSLSHISYNLFAGTAQLIWGGTYTSLSEFQQATGEGLASLEADPSFADLGEDNVRLQGESPAIDVGMSSGVVEEVFDRFEELYGIDIRKDIEGRPRPQGAGWDIGAYEYTLAGISDLASSGASQNSLTVAWTVPGADGSSDRPGRYDIRYAETAMTEANWEAATQVQGEPVPGDSGDAESFTLTGLDPGTTYYVAIKTSNDAGSTVSALSNVVSAATTTSGNRAPVLDLIGNHSVAENEAFSLAIRATDTDGDTLTYTVANVPTGAAFTAATRTFAWTPTNTQSGTYYVTFQVSDGQVTVSETITITVSEVVNHAPVLAEIGDQSVNESALLSLSISATDGDDDPFSFTATGLPPGANFTDQLFSWVPTYDQAGSYTVTFTVSDGELMDSEEITIVVANVVPDLTAPTANDIYPSADAIQIPLNALVRLTVSDDGHGVDANTVIIRVNDQTVYSGNSTSYDSAYGTCCRTGTPASYSYSYQPDEDFDFDDQVTVRVNASDLAGNAMTAFSYAFTTEMRAFGLNRTVSWGPSDVDKGHPATVCDSSGNIWVVYQAGSVGQRDIYISKMATGAENFAGPVQLTTDAGDQTHPSLAVDSDDKLYVVWQDNRQGNWNIYGRTSIDGVTWSMEAQITESDDDQIAPVVAVNGQSPNTAWLAWQDDGAGHQDIYVANSSNDFLTNASARVTSDAADQTAPDIAVDAANAVYLVWTDARNGSNDVYGADSETGLWTNVAVATGTGSQHSPSIGTEATGSLLHLVWVDDASGDSDIRYAASDGMPSGSLAGTRIIDDTSGATQTSPTLAVTGSTGAGLNVFVCWQDGRNTTSGGVDTDLYFTDVETGNETNVLVGDGGTSSSQSEPAIGVDGYGHPYVVWTDSRNVNVEVYHAGNTHTNSNLLESEPVTASAGGTVGVASPAAVGDVSVVIPAGACSHDVAVTIAEIENPQFASSSEVLAYEFGPSGLQFSTPVTITIPYTVADFPDGTPTPYWYDSQTGSLIQQGITDIESITISDTIHALRFRTTHFTPYALFDAVIDGGDDGLDGTSSSGGGGGGCALSPTSDGDFGGFLLPYLAVAMAMTILRRRDRKAHHGMDR